MAIKALYGFLHVSIINNNNNNIILYTLFRNGKYIAAMS